MIDQAAANHIRRYVLTKVNRQIVLTGLTRRMSGWEANELLERDSWTIAEAELVHRALLLPLHLTGIFRAKATIIYPESFLNPGEPRPEPQHLVVRRERPEAKTIYAVWEDPSFDEQYQAEQAEPRHHGLQETVAVKGGQL